MADHRILNTLLVAFVSTSAVLSQNLSSDSTSPENGYTNLPSSTHHYPESANNEYCTSTRDCIINDQHCDFNKCTCRLPKVYSERNGTCIEPKSLGESCDNNEECRQRDKLSKCDSICKCRGAAVEKNKRCQIKVQESGNNEPCNTNLNCIILGQYCEFGRCSCKWPKKYSTIHKRCYESKDLGQFCEYDEECEDKNSRAKCDFVCVCRDPYFEGTDGCQTEALESGNDEPCRLDSHCVIPGQFCAIWGRCTCRSPQTEFSQINRRCFKGKYLGDTCDHDEECQKADSKSECIGICKCRPPYAPGTYGNCKYIITESSNFSWVAIVFSVLAGLTVICIFTVCVIKCRSGNPIRGFVIRRNVEAPTTPPTAVMSDNPPSYDTVMSSNQQNMSTPPPLYSEVTFPFPSYIQPGPGQVVRNPHAGQTNTGFVND